MNSNNKIDEEQFFMEFVSLRKNETGLPVNVYFDEIGVDRDSKYNIPKIKFQNDYDSKINLSNIISISIGKKPEILEDNCNIKEEDLNKIINFILNNKNILMKHWNKEIGTMELFRQLIF